MKDVRRRRGSPGRWRTTRQVHRAPLVVAGTSGPAVCGAYGSRPRRRLRAHLRSSRSPRAHSGGPRTGGWGGGGPPRRCAVSVIDRGSGAGAGHLPGGGGFVVVRGHRRPVATPPAGGGRARGDRRLRVLPGAAKRSRRDRARSRRPRWRKRARSRRPTSRAHRPLRTPKGARRPAPRPPAYATDRPTGSAPPHLTARTRASRNSPIRPVHPAHQPSRQGGGRAAAGQGHGTDTCRA